MHFADRLLNWWQNHGRHDLPWQIDRTPYRVWVSEIMLQQTQVTTVIPYFQRFMTRFPVLTDLAEADLDDVLALWSGLGYYARARNLHASARVCQQQHGGALPADADALLALPGIGRSTAHAILAQAWNQRAPILDGNVKRVLARHAGIDGWPGHSRVLDQLWEAAEARTPPDRPADYTQAIMDLGAGICTPRKPSCLLCPVHADCRARLEQRVDQLPGRKPPRARPQRATTLKIIRDPAGRILLEKRPPNGIWGGLWCLPSVDGKVSGNSPQHEPENPAPLPPLVHQFTHFSLTIHFALQLQTIDIEMRREQNQRWFELESALAAGLPRPIRTAIEQLRDIERGDHGKPPGADKLLRHAFLQEAQAMPDTVFCQYLQREGEALARPPLPGELGQRIQQNICREAWQKWLAHQTLLINEKRLSPIDPQHRDYLIGQAEAFLFGGEFDRAEGYVPPE